MIDFHSHLIPGVDDGAADLDQSRQALIAMQNDGIRGLITTPHLPGSLLARPEQLQRVLAEIDVAWESLRDQTAAEMPGLRLERGAEIALDAPTLDLSDPRVRLAGTSFVLLEFPSMNVPPNSVPAIFDLRMKGWTPVIAHPERYVGVDEGLHLMEEWKRVGGLLQVNCGSLLGRYGDAAARIAWRLLARGWVDYLSSDYHARGRCAVREAREKLEDRGAEEQARLLMEVNPGLLLRDQAPVEVPPWIKPRRTFLSRTLARFRRRV